MNMPNRASLHHCIRWVASSEIINFLPSLESPVSGWPLASTCARDEHVAAKPTAATTRIDFIFNMECLLDFRLAFDLQNNGCRNFLRRSFWDGNHQVVSFGPDLQSLVPADPVGFQEFGALDLVLQAGQHEFAVRGP